MRNQWSNITAKATFPDGIGALTLVLIILIFFLGVCGPLSARNPRMVAQVEAATRQQQRLDGISATIRSLSIEIAQDRAQLAAAPLQPSAAVGVNQRISQLIQAAGECSVAVQDVKPGIQSHQGRFIVTPILLNGSGGYRDVARLLHRIHTRLPDVTVAAFRLAKGPDGSDASCVCELQLRWVSLATDPTQPPAITEAAADAQ